jgi:hypothetical protein
MDVIKFVCGGLHQKFSGQHTFVDSEVLMAEIMKRKSNICLDFTPYKDCSDFRRKLLLRISESEISELEADYTEYNAKR